MNTNTSTVVGFLFLVLCGVAAWLTLPGMWEAFTSLPPEVAGSLAGVAGAFVGVLYGKLMDRNSEIRARQRDKKAEAYQRFIRAWTSAQKSPDNKTATGEQFVEISRDVMLWASDEVLRQCAIYWRLMLTSKGQVSEPVIRELAKTILAIRKDLEHKNRRVTVDDIYTFFGKESGVWSFWPAVPSSAPGVDQMDVPSEPKPSATTERRSRTSPQQGIPTRRKT